MLECIEFDTGSASDATIVWLHGLGADGNDFVPIVTELGLDRFALRFVFPHAPMRPVTINGGMVMRAWYDIADTEIRHEDAKGVRVSQAHVEALIAREIGRGIAPGRIVLAGFSQGGAISLYTGLRHARRLGGIVALSCYLPLAATLAAEASSANRETPIFMAHGRSDPIVPFARALESRKSLEALGYRVEWHEYAMPHSVCMEEVSDIGAWLRGVLSQAAG